MRPYLDLLRHVLTKGQHKEDRTGTGTLSVFGYQMRFRLQEEFPLITTKRVWFRGLAQELLWFLSGSTNIRPLVKEGISIWTDWPLYKYLKQHNLDIPTTDTDVWKQLKQEFEERIRDEEGFAEQYGELGPIYGKQWRNFDGVDQITRLIESLRNTPHSRRHIVSAWNPAKIPTMALPPCHMFFQFYVCNRQLSCHMYIRSNDLFLGAPFNIAQYALLTHMVAQQTDLEPYELIYTIGDAHAYMNHLDQIQEQLTRSPYPGPELVLTRHPPSIFDYTCRDFNIINYQHHPPIKAPIAL